MNAVDTYHLCGVHNIFGMHKASGFRQVYNMDLDIDGEPHQDPEELNSYTMKSFAGVLAHQLMKFGESIDIGRVEFDRFGLLGLAVGGRNVLQEELSDDDSINVVDVRMNSNNLCTTSATTATGA